LEQVVIIAINHRQIDRSLAQSASGSQPAESSSNNDDTRFYVMCCHLSLAASVNRI
jgi:hypothetical protein